MIYITFNVKKTKIALLSALLLTNVIIKTSQLADLQAQLTTAESQLKALQDEVALYNQSQPILNNAKQQIDAHNQTIKTITAKIEDLTGMTTLNGSTSYNNNRNSNYALNDLNTKLQHEIDDLTGQNSLIDSSIVAARNTLGELRTRPVTADINKNIAFYQQKIAEYLNNKTKNDATIQKNRTTINNNKNTITLNEGQIKTYQAQVDAAKKIIADNQALIETTNAKLNATPNKINFSNITNINNNIARIKDTINSLQSQIANTSTPIATTTVTPVA